MPKFKPTVYRRTTVPRMANIESPRHSLKYLTNRRFIFCGRRNSGFSSMAWDSSLNFEDGGPRLAQPCRHHQACNSDGGKKGTYNAERKGDGEPSHRAGSEGIEDQRCE